MTSRRRQPFAPLRLPTASGAVIMAGGIFGAAALQRLPFAAALTPPLAALLAIGWIIIALSIAGGAALEGIAPHTKPLIGSFGIGTWVAASTVVARMTMLAAPDASWLWQTFFLAAVGLWLWFGPRAARNLVRIARAPAADTRPTGVILLTTVASQATALSLFRLFPANTEARAAAMAVMALGAVCYAAGAALVVRRYLVGPPWQLATDWDNTNCILHGALSITGLAAAVGHVLDPLELTWLWFLTLVVFLTVEAIELARLHVRRRAFGWRGAFLVYDTSQWARNFTFGMFYAFTAALVGNTPGWTRLGAVADIIARFGQYLVLLLLVAELALLAAWLAGRAKPGPPPHSRRAGLRGR